jgi:hypothetical protein
MIESNPSLWHVILSAAQRSEESAFERSAVFGRDQKGFSVYSMLLLARFSSARKEMQILRCAQDDTSF